MDLEELKKLAEAPGDIGREHLAAYMADHAQEIIRELEEVRRDAERPMQPLYIDERGVIRFKENKIVNFLVEGRLNEIAAMDFSQEDEEQLAQLIGYSLSGFGDLSYVSDEAYDRAEKAAEPLRATIDAARQQSKTEKE